MTSSGILFFKHRFNCNWNNLIKLFLCCFEKCNLIWCPGISREGNRISHSLSNWKWSWVLKILKEIMYVSNPMPNIPTSFPKRRKTLSNHSINQPLTLELLLNDHDIYKCVGTQKLKIKLIRLFAMSMGEEEIFKACFILFLNIFCFV